MRSHRSVKVIVGLVCLINKKYVCTQWRGVSGFFNIKGSWFISEVGEGNTSARMLLVKLPT